MMNMKKLIAALMLAAPLMALATAPADTVASINNPKSVVISKQGGSTTVHVKGTKKNPAYNYKFEVRNGEADTIINKVKEEEWGLHLPFLKNGRVKLTFISCFEDLYIDMVWPDSKESGVKTSWEVGFGRLIAFNYMPDKAKIKLTFGIGLGARDISFKHDRRLYLNSGHLSLLPPSENEKVSSSQIVEAEMRFPFMFTAPVYRDFKFSLGVVGIWNFYSDARSTWKVGDTKYSEKYKGLHQRLLNCEFVGTLGFDELFGITFHYRPLSDFTKVYGPEFKTLSLGLSFNF